MYKTNIFLFIILIIPFFHGCKTTKDSFYSYKVNGFTVDSVKRLLISTSLISYGDYLFEFRSNIKINSVRHGGDEPIVTSFIFDTIGVYLLGTKSKLYYEFDTFALKSNIRQTGKLEDKPFGTGFKDAGKNSDSLPFYSPPVETMVNNIKCFYSEVLSKNKRSSDSMTAKVLLVKIKKFNSVYKINGTKFKDDDYTIIGVNMYSNTQRQGFLNEIDALRPLTEKEKTICQNMVLKSKTCVTDTIKGLNIK